MLRVRHLRVSPAEEPSLRNVRSVLALRFARRWPSRPHPRPRRFAERSEFAAADHAEPHPPRRPDRITQVLDGGPGGAILARGSPAGRAAAAWQIRTGSSISPKTASAVKAQYSTATGSTTSPPNYDTTTAGTDNPLSTRRPHARRKFSASSPTPDRPDPPPARTDSLQKRSFDHDGWPALPCQRPRVLSRDAR
jgi:hypothetical protein